MNIHDSGYKRLFANLTMFRELIQTFVEEDWVDRLDFAHAERVDKSFVSEHYKETEADIIYLVPLRDTGQAVYFYLLLEFQSTVDRFMAVRVGHYMHSLWLDYRESHERVRHLPPIFPIVLYNGSERWTAPTVLSELIAGIPDLGEYRVEEGYFPIIINEYPLQRLLDEANTVTTLFIAEAYYDARLVIDRLLTLFEAGDPQAAALLANWFRQMRVHKRVAPEDYALLEQEYRSKEELQTMIVEAILKEEAAVRREAEARGKAEGKAEGKIEGKAEVAREMARLGYPLSVISNVLKLSEEEVQHLLVADQH